MQNILYISQKKEQKLTNIHVMKIHFKKMLKDELIGNPKWGRNIIDTVNMKKFVPILAFKRRSKVCFVMFQVNKYVLYFIYLTFCADKVKILR